MLIITYAIKSWSMVYLTSLMLKMRQSSVATVPPVNTGKVMGPIGPVIKNPSTVDANKIFDKSAKYLDKITIWSRLRCINFKLSKTTHSVKFSILKIAKNQRPFANHWPV